VLVTQALPDTLCRVPLLVNRHAKLTQSGSVLGAD
jgi:hypothetical protein